MEYSMKYQERISKMTLEEKASLLSGDNFWNTKSIDRLGVPSIMLTDGPHGLRKQGGKADHLGLHESIPSTCFPTAATLANSWDESLLEEVGDHIGREALSENVNVVLGPGLNIKRNPLNGRNFEYFSEDPFLSGKMAAAMIRGIQSNGVSACPKHFAVNSQEHLRMSIDEIVDERTLREIYLEGFRIAVEEGQPKTIMTSYNRVNGEYANENQHLLQDILIGEWGFQGVVVTDWGGNNDRLKGLVAGNHLEMPSTGGVTDREIIEAVRKGILSEDLLDDRVDRILDLVFSTTEGMIQTRTNRSNRGNGFLSEPSKTQHHEMAVEAAIRSMVLLRNEGQILPFRKGVKIGVVGDFAAIPRYQGAGSSLIKPTMLDSPLEALKGEGLDIIGYEPGYKRFGGKSQQLQKKAIDLVTKSELVLLFVGLDEGSEAEGIDRKNLSLPKNQLELIREITNIHENIVLVLVGGSPVEMPFLEKVQGVLHGYLGGQGSGEAMAKLLVGKRNPSGKLAESYPVRYEDILSSRYFPGKERTAEHREGLFVGYRFFETVGLPVRFPFGFGLSYTKFEYRDFQIDSEGVGFTIENVGDMEGEEIAQLYIVRKETEIFRARKELKGFKKVILGPGEKKFVKIPFPKHGFEHFNPVKNLWEREGGTFDIEVGASIQDIRCSGEMTFDGAKGGSLYEGFQHKDYFQFGSHGISEGAFEELLGRPLPDPKWSRKNPLQMSDIIAQGAYRGILGRGIYGLLQGARKIFRLLNRPMLANNVYFIMNMPFRQISRFTQNRIKKEWVEKFLKWI